MALGFYFIVGSLSISGALGNNIITSLIGRLREPSFQPVYGPFGLLVVSECLPKIIHFFLEKLGFIVNCFGPVSKCIDYTIFS